jgi:outer membrane protein TolC
VEGIDDVMTGTVNKFARTGIIAGALSIVAAAAAFAQTPAPAIAHGVPDAAPTAGVLPLSLADAVNRGLEHNLLAILQEQQRRSAGSARLAALAELLPHVSGNLHAGRQVMSTAAFGFTLPDLPTLIGPFNLYDARLSVSAPVVDVAKWAKLDAASSLDTAAVADYKGVRETVVLAVGNLYLMALADQARVASSEAQLKTAEALLKTATDQHTAGVVPQIDELRQQVQLDDARSQQISAANALATRKLQLARAIGLPAGQAFELTTTSAFVPVPAPTLETAMATAGEHRQDLIAARARVEAAEATRRAALAGHLPTLTVDGDVGAIGQTPSSALKTYTLAANVHVPLFSGGKTHAEATRADAELKSRQAELADLESGLRYDIEGALLTLESAAAAVDVAKRASDLSEQQLAQAQDRFGAGVANSIELAQAQEAVTRASERYITSLYAHAIAKAGLARAMGVVEDQFVKLVGGQQ